MQRYIAFLRAINVGGHNIKMAELKQLFTQLPLNNIETFIASGNVIFETAEDNTQQLSIQIENHLEQALGYAVATFIRTPAQVTQIIDHPAFPARQMATASVLGIGLLKQPLNAGQCRALQQLETDIDKFHTHNTEAYWLCARKQSESQFSSQVFEKQLAVSATFRGINTLKRLAAKYPV